MSPIPHVEQPSGAEGTRDACVTTLRRVGAATAATDERRAPDILPGTGAAG
ncbi:MAG: hypothetical protein JXA83_00070 [Acidimicrobiales bacterium]|nr:hypothetical protein [Acidimicrobiales bacterium]